MTILLLALTAYAIGMIWATISLWNKSLSWWARVVFIVAWPLILILGFSAQ